MHSHHCPLQKTGDSTNKGNAEMLQPESMGLACLHHLREALLVGDWGTFV